MIKKLKSRLSLKVFLITAALTGICCFVTYSFLSWAIPNFYKYDLKDIDEQEVSFIPEFISLECKENGYSILAEIDKDLQERYEGEFSLHLFQADGQETDVYNVNMDKPTGGHITDFEEIEETKSYQITFADTDSLYTLMLARNIAKHTQMEEALQRAFPSLCVVIFVSSIASALFYSWYMAAPIQKVSKISKQMAGMDFSGLCPTKRTDEIGVLSDSLNTLSRKLAAALSELREANEKLQADIDRERELERQRTEFFSAASHELKTPITIIKGQLQGMLYQVGRYKDRETYLAQSLEVTDTLEKMVQELLAISHLDAPGYTCKKSRLNLSKLVYDRLAAYEDLFMQKALTVEYAISPDAFILGDSQQLQKVLDNLLGNAAAYSGAGNCIVVNLWEDAEKVCLTIENTGAHIPDADIPKLFEAFYRVDPSRNRQTGGIGLGLYIVKTILDLHGASVKIENSVQGVIVRVQFQESACNST